MPQWKENLRNHKIFQVVPETLTRIETTEEFDTELNSDVVDRLILVLRRAVKILESTDLTYTSTDTLNSLRNNITAINANFDVLDANRSAPEAQTPARNEIESTINSMLVSLGQLRAIAYPINKESLVEKLGNLKLDAIKESEKIKTAAEAELAQLKLELELAKDDAIELRSSITDEKLRIDNLITQSQTEFYESQKSRDAEFAEKFKKDYGPKVTAKLKEVDDNLAAFDNIGASALKEFEDRAKTLNAALDGHVERAGLVSQAIAQKALKTTYEETSIKESDTAKKWSNYTLIVSAAMTLYVLVVLIQIIVQEKPFSPETIAPKVLLTAILVGIARWTAKLEKRHSDESRKYKQLSLELETIAPFIATLDAADQKAITKELVPKYFIGRSAAKDEVKDDEGESFGHPGNTIADIGKKLLPTKSE